MTESFTKTNSEFGICDAFGCNELTKDTIEVNAGTFGIVELNVCKKCVSKFEDSST